MASVEDYTKPTEIEKTSTPEKIEAVSSICNNPSQGNYGYRSVYRLEDEQANLLHEILQTQ